MRHDLAGLPDDREVFVRVSFQSLGNPRALSEPVLGRFVTPPAARGDDGGEGWHRGRDVRRAGCRGCAGRPLKVPGVVPRLSETPGRLRTPAPRLGEHGGECDGWGWMAGVE
jgi:hypothetical protein